MKQTAEQRLNAARGQYKQQVGGKPPAAQMVLPSPSAPLEVARCFIKAHCLHDGKPDQLTLRFWCGSFWSWTSTHWTEKVPNDVRSRLYKFTDGAVYWNAEMELVRWSPTRRKIDDLLDALKALILLSDEFEQPGWLDGRETGPIVALANGLLDLETRKLYPHTPLYFGQVAISFPYDPDAPEPTRWNGFLDALWPDEPEAIDVTGEWMGYVISGRTDLQKIFMMVGPTRGGKGLIARVLGRLLGRRLVCGPTLSSLSTDRGLMPLIGKSLAVISDARGSSVKGSSSTVVERLLSISGEDVLSIDRKYKEAFSGKLSTRLHVISNELPRLNDASGAIVGRLVLLLTKRSWLGKEDHKLENDLNKELPGILNFALDGLQRLTFENENRFTRYAGADQAISHLRDLASPVGAFVREQCVVEYGAEVNTDVLYAAYKEWCAAGEFVKSPRTHFGRDLLAACPGVKKTRPRIKGHRGHVYVGIRLRVAEDEEEPELSLSLDAQGDSVVTVVTTPATASAAGHDGHNENPLSNQQRPTAQVNGGEPAQNHGAPVVDTPNIPPGRIRELGDWVLEQAAIQNETSGDVNRAEIEEGLRIILREEAASLAEAEAAFKKVMDQVFAV